METVGEVMTWVQPLPSDYRASRSAEPGDVCEQVRAMVIPPPDGRRTEYHSCSHCTHIPPMDPGAYTYEVRDEVTVGKAPRGVWYPVLWSGGPAMQKVSGWGTIGAATSLTYHPWTGDGIYGRSVRWGERDTWTRLARL